MGNQLGVDVEEEDDEDTYFMHSIVNMFSILTRNSDNISNVANVMNDLAEDDEEDQWEDKPKK